MFSFSCSSRLACVFVCVWLEHWGALWHTPLHLLEALCFHLLWSRISFANYDGSRFSLHAENMPFHCFTSWHRAAHSHFCLGVFLTFFPFFSPSFKDSVTAQWGWARSSSTAIDFSSFSAVLVSSSQKAGTNKSFWFTHLSLAVAAVIS